jgi:hypothetical protein
MILIIYLIMVLAGCQETVPTTVHAQSTPIPLQEQADPEPEPKHHIGTPKPPPDKTVNERLDLLEGQLNWIRKRLKY